MSNASASSPSSTTIPGVVKTESPSVTSPTSPTDYSDPNSMAIAPYVPPTSFFQEFNLPFPTADSPNGLWDFDSTDGGGIHFVSGAQLDVQQDSNGTMMNGLTGINGVSSNSDPTTMLNSIPTNNNNVAGTSSAGAQIPSHIAKNNPFLNKLRRYVDHFRVNSCIHFHC